MRVAKGPVHGLRLLAAREDESQVTLSFRERNNRRVRLCGNPHVLDAGHRARLVDTLDRPVDAALRNRDHQHAGRGGFALVAGHVFTNGVPQQHLFERDVRGPIVVVAGGLQASGSKTQRARAETTNRPRGHLQHIDRIPVHAAFRMYRPVTKTNRPRRGHNSRNDALLDLTRGPRWRQINRLFEERAVEGIGLVEHRQQPELPTVEQPLDRVFGAWNKRLDERLVVRLVPFHAHVRQLQQASQTLEGGHAFSRAVDPHHAAAARERERLHDSRIAEATGQFGRVAVDRDRFEPRGRQSGGLERLPRQQFVAADRGCLRRMPGQTKRQGQLGGEHGGAVADSHDAVGRCTRAGADHGIDRPRLLMEAHRDRAIPPWILKMIAAIAGKGETDAKLFRRLTK